MPNTMVKWSIVMEIANTKYKWKFSHSCVRYDILIANIARKYQISHRNGKYHRNGEYHTEMASITWN